jgi:DNA-binding response OmpR family regulator
VTQKLSRPESRTMNPLHSGSSPIDVLIAEDNENLRDNLCAMLELMGRTCIGTGDGRDALELAYRARPGCVLLDLSLPGMDGYDVARSLRGDLRTRALHIHCLTGRRDTAARVEAYGAGIELYVTKPRDIHPLLTLLQQQARRPEIGALSCASLSEVSDLLDWLERCACTGLEMSLQDDEAIVRYVCPPGYRIVRDQTGTVCLLRS